MAGVLGYTPPRKVPGYGGLLGDVGPVRPGLNAYDPTLRDRVAAFLLDKMGSTRRVTEGLLGSTGLGISHPTGMGLVDYTPLGAPFWLNEAERSKQAQSGGLGSGMLDTMAAVPIPGAAAGARAVKKAAGKVDDAASFLRMYHGSPTMKRGAKYDVGHPKRTDFGFLGEGVNLTPNEWVAKEYAKPKGGRGPVGEVHAFDVPSDLRFKDFIYDENYRETLASEARRLGVKDKFDTPEWARNFTEALKREGYDGARGLNSDGSVAEMAVFDPSKIIPIDPDQPLRRTVTQRDPSGRPMYSAPIAQNDDALMAAALQGKEPEGIRDPMIAMHNLSPQNLRVADEIGGLPMPSIAASKVDDPLSKFGDITLVGGPDMVTPSRTNRVFVGDAYTGRQPRGEAVFADHNAAIKAMNADPIFGGTRAVDLVDMSNSLEDVDYSVKAIRSAVGQGLVDPNEHKSAWDLAAAAKRALKYDVPQDVPGIESYGQITRVLPQGFTPSGNRRKPKPYNIDNVMKEMRREGAHKQGGENFNYGPSSFRANQITPLRTFKDVKAARSRVLPESATSEAFDAFTKKHLDLTERVARASGVDGFGAMDAASEFMSDYAAGRGREWSGSWADDIGDELKREIVDLANEARKLPANYIEAKPNRAVNLSEFKGAIIPENAPASVEETIRKHGIATVYKYATPQQRKELFRKFPDLMFSVAAVLGGGAALSASGGEAQAREY